MRHDKHMFSTPELGTKPTNTAQMPCFLARGTFAHRSPAPTDRREQSSTCAVSNDSFIPS